MKRSILKQIIKRVNQIVAKNGIDDMKKSVDKILKEQCDMV
jgi:hypothetical protein